MCIVMCIVSSAFDSAKVPTLRPVMHSLAMRAPAHPVEWRGAGPATSRTSRMQALDSLRCAHRMHAPPCTSRPHDNHIQSDFRKRVRVAWMFPRITALACAVRVLWSTLHRDLSKPPYRSTPSSMSNTHRRPYRPETPSRASDTSWGLCSTAQPYSTSLAHRTVTYEPLLPSLHEALSFWSPHVGRSLSRHVRHVTRSYVRVASRKGHKSFTIILLYRHVHRHVYRHVIRFGLRSRASVDCKRPIDLSGHG